MAANSSPVPLGLAQHEQDQGAQSSSLQPHSYSVDAFTPRSDPDAPRSAFLTMNPRATTTKMVGINVHG